MGQGHPPSCPAYYTPADVPLYHPHYCRCKPEEQPMVDRSQRRLIPVPIGEVTAPRNGLFHVYCDYWWEVTDQEELLFYGTRDRPLQSPQCNSSEDLARLLAKGDMAKGQCKEIRQLPVVYVPAHYSDFR